MKTFILLVLSVLQIGSLISCSPDKEAVWQKNEKTYHKDIEILYPPNSERELIIAQRGQPKKSVVIAANSYIADYFISMGTTKIKAELGKDVYSCDVYWVSRGGAGSSFGAMGIYYDYVFYDVNNKVIKAYRRFVD